MTRLETLGGALHDQVLQRALAAGFDAVAFAPLAGQEARREGVRRWAAEGLGGGMAYLAEIRRRFDAFERAHPGLATAIVLAANYFSRGVQTAQPRLAGRVARYAWGRDYHQVLNERMTVLIAELQSLAPEARFVACVDTRPFSERSLAAEAGLGFIGRQGQLIAPQFGPWLFLAEILTDLASAELPQASSWGGCGRCTLCVDICPTQAIRDDRTIDARRCISYLTIEHKGDIPEEFRPAIKDWVFGCDECLAVCPYTSEEQETRWPELRPDAGSGEFLDLRAVLSVRSNRAHEEIFGSSAVQRASRKQLARNAAVVLGNLRQPDSVPLLAKVLREDPAPLVRRHAAWALGRIRTGEAHEVLQAARARENDPSVCEAIRNAVSSGNA